MEAGALDSEMVDMLLDQVKRVFALAKPGMLEAVNPEMQALFRVVMYAFSTWANKQTPGNMFMNLVFVNARSPAARRAPSITKLGGGGSAGQAEGLSALSPRPLTRRQRVAHALVFVILPWLAARGEVFMAQVYTCIYIYIICIVI